MLTATIQTLFILLPALLVLALCASAKGGPKHPPTQP
jgi:hypothetical protein